MRNQGSAVRRESRIKGEEGFTLIELAVALAILGILVAIAVPTYLNVRNRAYDAEAKQVLGEIRAVVWSQYLETGDWPDDLEQVGYKDAGLSDSDADTYATERWVYTLEGGATTSEIEIWADGVSGEPSAGRHWLLSLDEDGQSELEGPNAVDDVS